jgi:hypothetical protein
VCDCKTAASFVIAKTILCVTLQTQMIIFMIAKKELNQCVIATILRA